MDDSVQIRSQKRVNDQRGFFMEVYRRTNADIKSEQVSLAVSHAKVLRGLHMQKGTYQKVLVLRGEINAFFLDARPGSQSFASLRNFQLHSNSALEICCSPGIGFGYEALEDNTTLLYLHSEHYDPSKEVAISFDNLNPQFKFSQVEHIMSQRDKKALPVEKMSTKLLSEFF